MLSTRRNGVFQALRLLSSSRYKVMPSIAFIALSSLLFSFINASKVRRQGSDRVQGREGRQWLRLLPAAVSHQEASLGRKWRPGRQRLHRCRPVADQPFLRDLPLQRRGRGSRRGRGKDGPAREGRRDQSASGHCAAGIHS